MRNYCININLPQIIEMSATTGISRDILGAKIAAWQQRNQIFDRLPSLEELNESPDINYKLKAVDILLSDKAKEVFKKGNKSNWTLDKILTELQIPKEQKQLVLDLNKTNREEIITDLLANYSYTIEINTAKDKVIEGGYISTLGSKVSSMENRYGKYYYTDERGVEIQINKTDWETAKQIFDEFQKGNNKGVPTQYYSNLTVPGGTNYTENEIAIPDIIPSIKGHAQFATDKGIGWFRSDDKEQIKLNEAKKRIEKANQDIKEIHKVGIDDTYEKVVKSENKARFHFLDTNDFNNKSQKSVNIEHIFVPDKYRNKGYGLSLYIIRGEELLKEGKFLISYDQHSPEAEIVWQRLLQLGLATQDGEYGTYQYIGLNNNTKTRRILEVQSDLFQKGRDKESLFKANSSNINYFEAQGMYFDASIKNTEPIQITREEYLSKINKDITKENQFLQLLNKDNNWVTFFVKSIIQDSAKKGYEKVLFPSGNTASKVEGHTTLEEFKRIKESRIVELEYQKIEKVENILGYNSFMDQRGYRSSIEDGKIAFRKENNIKIDNEINQLKQELKRIETEGFGALKPIYNFYENTVTNILNKQYGKENVTKITDEYGNTWNEVTLDLNRDLSLIPLAIQIESKATKATSVHLAGLTEGEGTVQSVLEALSERNELAKQLLPFASRNNVRIRYGVGPKAAAYYPDKNEILINPMALFTQEEGDHMLLHEILHALTAVGGRELQENLMSSYESYKARAKNPGAYGFKSIDEFIAELSNPLFVQDLKNDRSLWTKFLDALRKFFGMDQSVDSLLTEVLSSISTFKYDETQASMMSPLNLHRGDMTEEQSRVVDIVQKNTDNHVLVGDGDSSRYVDVNTKLVKQRTTQVVSQAFPEDAYKGPKADENDPDRPTNWGNMVDTVVYGVVHGKSEKEIFDSISKYGVVGLDPKYIKNVIAWTIKNVIEPNLAEGNVILAQQIVSNDKIGGAMDIVIIKKDGSADIIDVKTSSRAYTDLSSSQKRNHMRQLSIYKRLLTDMGVKVNKLQIMPLKVMRTEYDTMKKNIQTPLALKEIAYVAKDINKIIPPINESAPGFESSYADVCLKIMTALEERLTSVYSQVWKSQDLSKLTPKQFNELEQSIDDAQERLNNIIKMMNNIVSDADRVAAFIELAHKELVGDGNGYVTKMNNLLNQDIKSQDDAQAVLGKYVTYFTYATNMQVLEEIKLLFPSTPLSSLEKDSIEFKLQEALLAKKDIIDKFNAYARPIVGFVLQAYSADTAPAIDVLNNRINRYKERLDALKTELLEGKITQKYYDSRVAKLERTINESLGDKNKFNSSIEEQLKLASKDISFLERWISPVINSGDMVLGTFAKAIKTRLEKSRQKLIIAQRNIQKIVDSIPRSKTSQSSDFYRDIYEVKKSLTFYRGNNYKWYSKQTDDYSFVSIEDSEYYSTTMTEILNKANESKKRIPKETIKQYFTIRKDIAQHLDNIDRQYRQGILTKDEFIAKITSEVYDSDSLREVWNNNLTMEEYCYTAMAKLKNGDISIVNDIKSTLIEFKHKINPAWEKIYRLVDENNPMDPQSWEPRDAIGQAHKDLLNEFQEALKLLPPQLRKRQGNKLPFIRAELIEKIARGEDITEAIKGEITDKFSASPDDDTYAFEDKDKVIPVRFISRIPHNEVSLDIGRSLLLFKQMAENYAAANAMASLSTATSTFVRGRDTVSTDSRGKAIINRAARRLKVLKTDDKISKASEALDDFINKVIYGEYRKKNPVTIGGVDIMLDKVVDSIIGFGAFTQLGGPNLLTSTANYLNNTVQSLIESASKEFFSTSQWLSAHATYMMQMPQLLQDFGTASPNSTFGKIIELMDPLQGDFLNEYGNNVSSSVAGHMMRNRVWYFLNHQADHSSQVTAMIAILKNEKYGESTLWDYMIEGNDLSQIDQSRLNIIRNRLHEINKKLNGVYNSFDKGAIDQHAVGRLLMMYRKFIEPGITRRYSKMYIDQESGRTHEGYFRTLGNLLINDIGELAKQISPFHESSLTEFEKNNVKRAMTETMMLVTLSILALIAASNLDDDEEETWASSFFAYEAIRLSKEISFFSSPGSFMSILSTPTAAESIILRFFRLVNQFFNPTEVYERKVGIFDKGDNKLLARFLQLLGLSGYNVDPEYAAEVLRKMDL